MLREEQFRRLLEELPEREPRSRLDEYRELILEMRRRRYSYREISRFLLARVGLRISHNAVRNFVNRICDRPPEIVQARGSEQRATPNQTGGAEIVAEAPEHMQAVRERIATLKRQPQSEQSDGPVYRFDAAKPLRLPDEKV
jgi:hypothetical protein